MFRQFVNPLPKGAASKKGKTTESEVWFLYAEFGLEEEGSLSLAVTNGASAWLSLITGDDFNKLVTSCRIGSGSREDFILYTKDAFREPTASPETDVVSYVLDAQISATQNTLHLKWKLKEPGFSQIIGQAKLMAAANSQLVIDRILSFSVTNNRVLEEKCANLVQKIKETKLCTEKMKELAGQPSVRAELIERCVEVLNDAKMKNRAMGASSKQFEDNWETFQAESMAIDEA